MGKHKDAVINDAALDLAYTRGWDAAVRRIRELAEDSDFIRASDIDEHLPLGGDRGNGGVTTAIISGPAADRIRKALGGER